MKQFLLLQRASLMLALRKRGALYLLALGLLTSPFLAYGQVTLTATAGTASGSFTTLKLAFDAINAGTHQGDIVISINANTTEGTTPATLNSTGAGSSVYTSVLIRPTADGLSVSGNPATGFGVIQLKGADNVTIDGDNPNTGGTNRNLTIQNTATSTTTFASVIRIATVNVANALSANGITIKNCVLTGNASGRNASGNTSTTASENNTFGVYVGGNGGTTAIDAPIALSSVTTNTIIASTTVNTLLIDNNAVSSVARAVVFNGSSSASSTGVTISNNAIGNAVALTGLLPYTAPTTSVYTKGIWINGTNAITISGNTIRNIISYVPTVISAIEFVGAIGSGTLNVSNNTIDGVIANSSSSTSKFGGIVISNATGAFTISGNNISNVEGYNTTTTGISAGGVGIDVNTSATSATISNNIVNKVYNRGGTGYGARGVVINGGNNVTIQNNVVTDINNIGSASFSPTYGIFGILVGAGIGHKVYHNSVNIFGANLGTGSNLSACLGIAGTGLTGIDVRNNIFSNTMTTSNASSASVALFLPSGGSSAMNLLLNNNAYYTGSTAGLHGICHVGTTYGTANLYRPANFVVGAITPATNLRAYTSTLSGAGTNDNASYASTSVAPYTSNTNLSLNTSSSEINQVENKGATGTGVATDILGVTRPNAGTTNPDMGAYEINLIPLLSIADNGAQPSVGNINQGSTSNILQSFMITEGNLANATLNTVTIPLSGNYVAADIQASGLKLWRSTINLFSGATAFTGVTATASGSGETATFSSLAFGITKNTVVYFWVTTDITAGATAGNTINANALAPANTVFALGTPTGTVSAGGVQTVFAATPTISLASDVAPVSAPTQGTNNVVLYRVDVTVATTTAVLNAIQFTTAGTYTATDVSNFKIWYSTANTFAVGTSTFLQTKLISLGAGAQAFTGLTQNYAVGTNYLYLTADLLCATTASNTISVSAIPDVDATFASGTFGTNTTAGSGTVTFNLATPNNATGLGTTPALSTVALSWTAPTGCYDEVMIVASPAANTGGTPSGNGSAYTANLAYTSGTAFGNGFVAYKGTTSPQIITGLTSGITYFFKVFTRNGANWSVGVEASTTTTSYCGAPLHTGTLDYITNTTVAATTLNSSNGVSLTALGYSLISPTPSNNTAVLGQGVSYPITITVSSCPIQIALWVDFNQNGAFETTEYFLASCSGSSATATIAVPVGATLGTTRMRIRARAAAFTNAQACLSFVSGETEDYTITIGTAPTFTVADNGIQVSAGNIIQGTTNNILQSFTITEGGNSGGFLSQVAAPLAGNYVAGTDIATLGLKIWGNTTNTFATATALSTKTGTSVGAGETVTFNGMNFGIPQSGIRYFWVTTDLQSAATLGNTINANTYTSANVTFTLGSKSGSVTAGGAQTIVAPPIFYLKAGGAIATMSDWGTATDGLSGSLPTTLTQSGAIWNIRNNTTVTNPAAWTLGSGSKIIVGDGTTATNFTLPVGANVTGTIDVTNLGTLTLRNTTNPTLGALAIGSTIDYNGIGAQTIAIATYSNLTISGARIGSPVVTLASGTINVSGAFMVTTTGVGSYTNTGNTVNFSSAGMQTIPAISYLNITNTGNGNRTLASSGNIGIANFFTPGSGAYTVTGSTVVYNSTTITSYTLFTFTYNNLVITASTNPDYLIIAGNTVTVLGNFQVNSGFFAVNNSLSGTSTLNITGDCNVAGGMFIVTFYSGLGVLNVGGNLNVSGAGAMFVTADAGAPSTTVTVNGNVGISGTSSINLEGTSSGSGVAILVCLGDFTVTSTSTSVVDFGTGTVTNNEFRIGGNFNKSGTGTFNTASSSIAKGFVFSKVGTQTFSYTGANSQYTQYTVASGSALQMLTGVTLPTSTTPTSTFTINNGGILDMGTQVITAGNTTDPIFTLASGATIKTARTTGLTTNFSGFGASRLVLSSLANYEFNGSSAQVTSAFVTTPTALTVAGLTINNSAGVTLTNNLTASNTLTMTAGNINAGANTLTLGTSAVSTGTLAYTSGTILGQFKRWIAASATGYDFPIGIATQTRNANIAYTGAPTTGGSLTAQFIAGEAGASGLPLTEGSITASNVAQGVWQINAGDGLVDGTYTATINGFGFSGITDFSKLVMLKRANNGSLWTLAGTHVTTTGSNGVPILQRTGLTGFSEFGAGGGIGNPLPLTLLSFKATRIDAQSVRLDWRTALELDLKTYQVEKSYDGTSFSAAGKVEVKAGNGTKEYSFATAENKSAYYRLRYLHHNLPDELSPIRFVRGGEDDRIVLYPNPLAGEVKIDMNIAMRAATAIKIQVLNAQGKAIATYSGDWDSVLRQFNQGYPNWTSGVYMLQIQAQGTKQQTLKVVR